MSTQKIMDELVMRARAAALVLAQASDIQKNRAICAAATQIRLQEAEILAANSADIASAENLSAAMLDRLKLNSARVDAMAAALESIAGLADPVGKILSEWKRPNGLQIARISVPLGVVGIIYESRPNVTADASGLCLKSGNAVILRGGSESSATSAVIAKCIRAGLRIANLPEDAVQIVPTKDREAVGFMLSMAGKIDVIIPRGGKNLCERVQNESRVPTLLHLEGNCHTYIHTSADFKMAEEILLNAKMRRTGICGATESLLIDREIAAEILPKLVAVLSEKNCEIRGDADSINIDARIKPATEDDWRAEYLSAILSVKIIDGLEEAVAWINNYGSHHTDAIIASAPKAAEYFLANVDSAIVMHNASTQFADGGEFGLGAEIGIATGRLHARGPVGAEQLVTYKYLVHGNGQIRPLA